MSTDTRHIPHSGHATGLAAVDDTMPSIAHGPTDRDSMIPASSAGLSTGTDAAGTSPVGNRRMFYSRLIGLLFLGGFVTYGVGSGLVASVVGGDNFLSAVPARQTTLIVGALLMLLNSVVDVGKGVLFFPILDRYNRRTAHTYLATMIIEALLLAIGVLSLLMIVPLAQRAGDAGPASASWAHALSSLAVQSNTMIYQIGEAALGLGAVFLCLVLLRTRLVPRTLGILGLIGYPILAAGNIADIFGLHIGLILSTPGALFELALAAWLLIKGFDAKAYGEAT